MLMGYDRRRFQGTEGCGPTHAPAVRLVGPRCPGEAIVANGGDHVRQHRIGPQ